MAQRLGTFEEWYQWEMKQRDNPKSWHYPTELTFTYYKNDTIYRSESRYTKKAYPNRPVYRTRGTGTDWDKENRKDACQSEPNATNSPPPPKEGQP